MPLSGKATKVRQTAKDRILVVIGDVSVVLYGYEQVQFEEYCSMRVEDGRQGLSSQVYCTGMHRSRILRFTQAFK